MTIGPDGKPVIQEFGNVKPSKDKVGMARRRPPLSAEREPLVDVNIMDDQVTVVMEMPGVNQSHKINAFDDSLEVSSTDPKRKYNKTIDLPKDVDVDTAKSKFNNDILEILFNKKKETTPKGKEIKIN